MSKFIITFLSDFGYRAESAGVCRAVIKSLAPEVEVLDLCHGLPPFDVRAGALALENAVPFCPLGVHLAVVDPGVGGPRRPVALQAARGDFLVGPDNGLLIPAARRLGGITRAHLLENPEHMLHPVSATFHGRDLFAPAAAFLARGGRLEELGRALSPEELAPAPWGEPALLGEEVAGEVLGYDQYGSLKLNLRPEHLQALGLQPGELVLFKAGAAGDREYSWTLPFVRTFGDVPPGQPCLLTDSDGRLAVAVNLGSARSLLGLAAGAPVRCRRPADAPAP
ncbi:MAG: SAM-dependent chlorinase/fluorinase [Bacillota bacterium]|nr:SAM-dependent chlorinase/fluorinase [Bacillota bacterium]